MRSLMCLQALVVLSTLSVIATAETSAESCEELAELQCIEAADCTLHQDAGRGSAYRCRAAANACERGFEQKSGAPEDCESKAGCVYVPQDCYCAPDVICRCAGGPPRRCLPTE